MRTLHAVPTPITTYTPTPDTPVMENPTCGCGSTRFSRMEWISGRERHFLDFRNGQYPGESWDTIDSDPVDADQWQCVECSEICSPELQDLIDDQR